MTKCLKPPDSSHEFGDCASVQAATRVNAEQTSHDEGLVKGSHYGHIDSLAGSCCGSQTKVCESREAVCNQPWVKGMMQMVTIDPWSASDRIGFPAYQGNNREIRRSGRAHHRIYVEKTVYLSYFEPNSLRNRTGN